MPEQIGIFFNDEQKEDKKIIQAWFRHLCYKTGKTRPQILREALQDLNLKYDERGNVA